jgi:hypothetical protein
MMQPLVNCMLAAANQTLVPVGCTINETNALNDSDREELEVQSIEELCLIMSCYVVLCHIMF